MTLDYAAAEAAGHCECGQSLDSHDPLPKPRPWAYGRPCSKTSLDRGHGWDGKPLTEPLSAARAARWSQYVSPDHR